MIHMINLFRKSEPEDNHTILIRAPFLWLLKWKTVRTMTKILQLTVATYNQVGSTLTLGNVITDPSRSPDYTKHDLLVDGKYIFSIEQDVLK